MTIRPDLTILLRADDSAVAPAMERTRQRVEAVSGSIDTASAGSDRLGRSLQRIGQYGAAAFGLSSVVNFGRAIYDASVGAERLATTLSFASARGAVQELAFLRGATQDLGLSMRAAAPAFASFLAAARGTALEGQAARDVFLAVSQAASVMGLSADQTSGALLALQQMVSKGVVSAEELRGQLGERLPGAFQIAARSMGVTTAELGQMLQRGEIVADVFLPKFAAQLRNELGGAANDAANRVESATNRMSNAWDDMLRAFGDAGGKTVAKTAINEVTVLIRAMGDAMDEVRAKGGGELRQFVAGAGTGVARFFGGHFLTDSFDTFERRYANAQSAYSAAVSDEALLAQQGLRRPDLPGQLFGSRTDIDQARARLAEMSKVRQVLTGDDGSTGSDARFVRGAREMAETMAADTVMANARASFREQELDIFLRRVRTERGAQRGETESDAQRVARVLAGDIGTQGAFIRSERGGYDDTDKDQRDSQRREADQQRREAEQLGQRQRNLQQQQDEDYQRRVASARAAASDLEVVNAELSATLIRDDRARGQAQLALQEQALRDRMQLEYLGADERQQAEEGLARWRVLREAQLTDELKPQWQRMAELWADTMRDMAQRKDEFLSGFVDRGRDAFQDFLATGRLSTRSLTDFIRTEFARLAYERFLSGYVRGAASTIFDLFLGSGRGGTGGGGNAGFGDLISLDSLPGRASGGSVQAGGAYLVGERGPEVLRMGAQGGYVVPNSQMHQVAGGITIHQTFAIRGNEDAATLRALASMVKHETLAAVADARGRGNLAFGA